MATHARAGTLGELLEQARRGTQQDERSGPAAQSPGDEVPSDAGAREPSAEDTGARTAPRDHGSVTSRTAAEIPGDAADAPLGFTWLRDSAGGPLRLMAAQWFVARIAKEADEIFMSMREKLSKDPEVQDDIAAMGESLRAYVDGRFKYNQMAADRKIRGEMDDACYQLCQSAKYYLDAMERAQAGVNAGRDISDDQRIETLSALSKSSAIEGYVVAAAVYSMAEGAPVMNFQAAAKRVADYSARKLTEWYAAREQERGQRLEVGNNAALQAIVAMFGKKAPA